MAQRLGLAVAAAGPAPASSARSADAAPYLLRSSSGWTIVVPGLGQQREPLRFSLDFSPDGLSPRLRRKLGQPPTAHPLFIALGRPRPGLRVVDGTGGFGSDALLMARCFGLHVTVVESNPLVFALLHDASRTQAAGAQAPSVFGGAVLHGEAEALLPQLGRADVVYLDPMFPRHVERRGKPDLAMQVLAAVCSCPPGPSATRHLDPAEAERRLLAAARACASQRVVVKRARASACLGGVQPAHQVAGTLNRFDIYPCGVQ